MKIEDAWSVVTNSFAINSVSRIFCAALIFALPVAANAIVIALEPDDFGVGVPLENAYVTTALVDGPLKNHSWNKALVAYDRREQEPDYKSPTGDLIFGVFPFLYKGDPAGDLSGLGIKFHQDVLRITLLANSIYPPGDLQAAWIAFDIDGKQIASGYAGGDRPASETFEIEIGGRGVRSLILGGDYNTSAICFDHLTFEVNDASVSEPAPIILLTIGFVMLRLRRKSRLPCK